MFDASDGILGIEARHSWNNPFAGGGAIVLNQLDWENAAGSGIRQRVLPDLKVDRISGIFDLPEIEDVREPLPGRIGELAYAALQRGKSDIYEGRIRARTLRELRQRGRAMKGAFAGTTEGTMTVAPHPDQGVAAWHYRARVMQFTCPDEQLFDRNHLPTPWIRPWVLTLRQSDPRYYIPTIKRYPSADPLVWTNNGLFIDPVVNDGNAPTDPIFELKGLIAGTVEVQNVSLGHTLRFDNVNVPVGQRMLIDFRTRKAINTTTLEDLVPKLRPDLSTWWDETVIGLQPGGQRVIAQGAGFQGTWAVSFYSADW